MKDVLLVIPVMLLIGTANALLKAGVDNLQTRGIEVSLGNISEIASQPAIVAAFVLTGSGILLWLSLVSRVQMSLAYPAIQGGAIVITAVMCTILLRETLSATQSIGMGLIVMGIVVIAKAGF